MVELVGDEVKGKPGKNKMFCVTDMKRRIPVPKLAPVPCHAPFAAPLKRFVAKPVLDRLDVAHDTLAELRTVNGMCV
jgi:hypothetical protein